MFIRIPDIGGPLYYKPKYNEIILFGHFFPVEREKNDPVGEQGAFLEEYP